MRNQFQKLNITDFDTAAYFDNNYTTITSLRDYVKGSSIWEFEQSILVRPSTVSKYYKALLDAVGSKTDAGFEDSITDYW